MLKQMREDLAKLKAEQFANEYEFDGYTYYRDGKLANRIGKQITELEEKIALHAQFEGDPMQWSANGDSIKECEECPHSEKCKRWNDYLNSRPIYKHFDQNGDVIEYDKYGNLKYQIVNLKTGEKR